MNKRIKHLFKIAVISALTLFCLFLILNLGFLDSISYSITFSSLMTFIYEKYIWKVRLFNFFNNHPHIEGEYEAEINYLYKGGGKKEPTVNIKQTFLTVNVELKSDEMTSNSITGDIVEEDGKKILYYSYRTNPKAFFREDNPIKIGTARIIIEKEELTGTYWTQAGTSGDIKLNKKKRKANKK